MELDRQLQELIDDAPNYGVPSMVIERAIAPVLGLFAKQLQHESYYILQNLQDDWVLTTITNPKLQQDKRVIYAFVSVQDAATFDGKTFPDLIAVPNPVIHLLFRLFSLHQVDSMIFLENSQNLNQGVEIEREYLSKIIQEQIEQLRQIPPDIV